MVERSFLDLQGGVVDPKPGLQLPAYLMDHGVIDRRSRSDQRSGKRGLRRAHSPDVQIMHLVDTRQSGEVVVDGSAIHAEGHRLQREIERFAQERPGSGDDDRP